jgi:hypothetical protein
MMRLQLGGWQQRCSVRENETSSAAKDYNQNRDCSRTEEFRDDSLSNSYVAIGHLFSPFTDERTSRFNSGLSIEAAMARAPSEAAATYDVVVIGSGVGGYTAAIRAGQLGLKTKADIPDLLSNVR